MSKKKIEKFNIHIAKISDHNRFAKLNPHEHTSTMNHPGK